MMNWLKHYFWFVKASYSFLDGFTFKQFIEVWIKAFYHARFMCAWEAATPEQREYWYLTTDRTVKL